MNIITFRLLIGLLVSLLLITGYDAIRSKPNKPVIEPVVIEEEKTYKTYEETKQMEIEEVLQSKEEDLRVGKSNKTQNISRGGRQYSVPADVNTNFKTYYHYQMITDKTSRQWELQQQAYTDDQGFRRVGEDYCVALGTYYGTDIGDRYEITLENGNSFTAVLADMKQDRHTDDTNRYVPHNGNVIEFLIDIHKVDNMVKLMGSVSVVEGFEGNVVGIEKIENVVSESDIDDK